MQGSGFWTMRLEPRLRVWRLIQDIGLRIFFKVADVQRLKNALVNASRLGSVGANVPFFLDMPRAARITDPDPCLQNAEHSVW